jgi:glycogen operon protein
MTDRKALLAFTRKLIGLRRAHPSLHRAKFFKGRQIHGADVRDVMWFNFDGREMNEGDWSTPWAKSLMMFLAGKGLDETDEKGEPVGDDDLLVIIHGGHEPMDFVVPEVGTGAGSWELLLDTNDDGAKRQHDPGDEAHLEGRSPATSSVQRQVAGAQAPLHGGTVTEAPPAAVAGPAMARRWPPAA